MILNSNEILQKVPDNWQDLKLKTWIKMLDLKTYKPDLDDPLQDVFTSLQILSIVLDLPLNIVEKFPLTLIKDVNKRLEFLQGKPEKIKKSKYKWINSIEDPTYDDFITYVKINEQLSKGDYNNFVILIKTILRQELTEEEILEMPMSEVENGFFLLRKFLMKYLKSIEKDLQTTITIQKTMAVMEQMQGMKFHKKLNLLKEKFKGLMGFTSSQKM